MKNVSDRMKSAGVQLKLEDGTVKLFRKSVAAGLVKKGIAEYADGKPPKEEPKAPKAPKATKPKK